MNIYKTGNDFNYSVVLILYPPPPYCVNYLIENARSILKTYPESIVIKHLPIL